MKKSSRNLIVFEIILTTVEFRNETFLVEGTDALADFIVQLNILCGKIGEKIKNSNRC